MRPEIHARSTQTFPATFFHFFRSSKVIAAVVFLLILLLLLLPSRSYAHPLSVSECKEGGDFIRNAALARDNGVAPAAFLDRISDDIEIIRSFPSQLRWFVQDDSDAKLLLSATANVFQHPKTPHAHQVDFFNDCIANAKATSSLSRTGM
jgi:hypothetical protein